MSNRLRAATAAGATAALALASGCHIDMWQQPRARAYGQSEFFPDRLDSRPLVEGTVARGELRLDDAYETGKLAGKPIPKIPPKSVVAAGGPKAMLDRGERLYNIYCQPCHGRLGDGNGFIAQRGLGYWQKLPASLHIDRLKKAPDGQIYDVLVNGKGVMYGYAARIQEVEDRWAVVAYVRALQKLHTNNPQLRAPAAMAEQHEERRGELAPEGGAH